ncbi:hypothetical protein Mboo_1182 [Methanoregula boonei 6A8]|jgi:hypothetical protein|uniref:Uncharacterized protein n=1 Tax=Methanoregula boonei (strain DSM 21154 / JCM 14090 / 6A8) TaxID=456442 RepID=A7I7I9_METB6|nr:hypothetical protein [Methanoregula boonei]ABS55700.1 hypothetical protein Mboo_1182 [Methanoregula boonei 6A8]
MKKEVKTVLALVVFALVSLYCMMTNLWILWAGITAMLFIDALIDSLKDWLDTRQERYLDAMKKMNPLSENPETLLLLQQSITRIENKLDVLEKTWEKQ